MKRADPSSPFFRRASIAAIVMYIALFLSSGLQPVMAAPTFPQAQPVQVNTSTGSQLFEGTYGGSCSYGAFMYAFWLDGSNVLWYATSQNGISWGAPTSLGALPSIGTMAISNNIQVLPFKMACSGNLLEVVWSSVSAGSSSNGLTNWISYDVFTLNNGVVTLTTGPVQGPDSKNNFAIHSTASGANTIGCLGIFNGIAYYCTYTIGVGNIAFIANNQAISNSTPNSNLLYSTLAMNNGGAFLLYASVSCQYAYSSDGGNTWSAIASLSGTYCTSGSMKNYVQITTSGQYFLLPTDTSTPNSWVIMLTSTAVQVSQLATSATTAYAMGAVTTDGTNYIAILSNSGGVSQFEQFTISGTTFSVQVGPFAITLPGNLLGGSTYFSALATSFSPTLEMFAVQSITTGGAPFIVYETVFGTPQITTSQTQTIGSCPPKNTATTTLVNNTEYFYTGSAISGASINTVSTFVAQVTSATAPQTLSLGIYATLNPGSVSASNTLFLIAAFSKSLTAGTTNNAINWSPGIGLTSTIVGTIPQGATIGVAILGTNKIKINQSSLAGMTTGSTSGGVLASTFTSLSSNAAQLDLCMTLSFQGVITTTATVTSTSTSTTSVTTTVSNLSNPALLNSNFMLAIIVILGPSLLLAAVTKSLWGGILGALLGAATGAFIGFVPFWVPVVVVVGCITILFFARGGGGDKM